MSHTFVSPKAALCRSSLTSRPNMEPYLRFVSPILGVCYSGFFQNVSVHARLEDAPSLPGVHRSRVLLL